MEGEKRKIRVRGIVIPVEWDAEGNAIKAAISAVNEEEYLIEDDKNSGQFLGLIQQEVDVRGMVREEANRKLITVERCQRVKQHKIYGSFQK